MTFNDGLYPPVRVVGVTSHAYDEQNCSVGGVDTRVDVHWGWLESSLVEGCSSGVRALCPDGGKLSVPLAEPADRLAGYSRDEVVDDSDVLRDSKSRGDSWPGAFGCNLVPSSSCSVLLYLLALGCFYRRR